MGYSRVAVLIPCLNEAQALPNVIRDFKRELPEAVIYVYDNGSVDNSVEVAKASGAIVKHVKMRGKGKVVRQMFADVDADIYVMVDGDDTYDAKAVHPAKSMLIDHSLDMVVCTRVAKDPKAYPIGHAWGNQLFTRTVDFLFGHQFSDIFSGYRVFSKRFVKSFPAISQGFEVESEITIHALQLGLPVGEIETAYQERPEGTASKLKTLRDGFRILRTILMLFFYIRPMAVFGMLFVILAGLSLLLGAPLVIHFIEYGDVPRIPTAILAAGLGMMACVSMVCGIVLDSVSRTRLEAKRCWYMLASVR